MTKWSARTSELRERLEEALRFVKPLELSLVFSTMALVFLVAANYHGGLI